MKRSGLFHGYWSTLDGQRIRRVRRDEYGTLYGLWRRHTDIRLGVRPIGTRPGWADTQREPGERAA